jgi:hypothetical protein
MLRRAALALIAWFPGLALAAGPALIDVEGDLRPGDEAPLQIAWAGEGAPEIVPAAGRLLGRTVDLGDGRWRVRYRAPDQPGEVTFAVQGLNAERYETQVTVSPHLAPTLQLPSRVNGVAGPAAGPVLLAKDAPSDQVRVGVSEGEAALRATPEGGLYWTPGAEPFPRAVPLLVSDGNMPEDTPAAMTVFLRARPRLPIQTEPGTRVTVQVGGRTYGPFVADAEGTARASAEVRPGERTATLVLEDAAGNQQRSDVALGGDARPALAALAERRAIGRARAPRVYLFAVRADGRPWTSTAPECLTSVGAAATVVPAGKGRWVATVPGLPNGAWFDIRVDCQVDGRARASVRIPAMPPRPARIVLRAWPQELPADVPRAQIHVALESEAGDRLPSERLHVQAELGEIEFAPADAEQADGGPPQGYPMGGVRAVYKGEAAVAAGRDTLTATWSHEPGQGPPWSLLVGARDAESEGHVRIRARALDRHGRPLTGVSLRMSAGGESVTALTGPGGWAVAATPRSGDSRYHVVRVEGPGGLIRQLPLPAGQDIGPAVSEVDMQTSLVLPIRTGQVRQVFLTTEPRTLVLTGGERARVIIRLEDQDGNPVEDPTLSLLASEGVVTRPRRRLDGAYEALWAPPPGLPYGQVHITASSEAGAFAATTTDLDVVPRDVQQAPGLSAGWLLGTRGFSSPFLRLSGDVRLPWTRGALYGRGWVGLYAEQAMAEDDASDLDLAMDISVLPVGLGVATRQERGRLAGWLGASVVIAPYRMEARFDQTVPRRGVGIASPGFEVVTGGGWRLRSGEVTAEFGYLFLAVDETTVGWRGPIGGGLGTLGYRLVY